MTKIITCAIYFVYIVILYLESENAQDRVHPKSPKPLLMTHNFIKNEGSDEVRPKLLKTIGASPKGT